MAVMARAMSSFFGGGGEQRVFVVVTRFLAACGGRLGAEKEADRVYSLPSPQSGSSQLSWPRDERRKGRGGARSPRLPFAFPPFRLSAPTSSSLRLSAAALSLSLHALIQCSKDSPPTAAALRVSLCIAPSRPARAVAAAELDTLLNTHTTDLNKLALLYAYPAATYICQPDLTRLQAPASELIRLSSSLPPRSFPTRYSQRRG